MNYQLIIISIIAILVHTFCTNYALATQQIPSSVEPGAIEHQLKDLPLEQQKVNNPNYIKENVKKAEPAQNYAAIQFLLNDIVFDGMTVYSSQKIRYLYEDKIGKTISLADINSIIEKITLMYRNDGYLISYAILPVQTIKNGVVKIQIIEGYIDNIVYENTPEYYKKIVSDYLNKLKESRPLKEDDLERYLLLANELPGLRLESILKASEHTDSASDLHVTFYHTPYDGSASVENRGVKYIGPWQHTAKININSAFGTGEQTSIRMVTTDKKSELRYFNINFIKPISSDGAKFYTSISKSRSNPGDDLEDFDILSYNTTASIGISKAFVRTRTYNLDNDTNITYKSSKTTQPDISDTQDKLWIISDNINFSFSDFLKGRNSFTGGISQGIDILNQTPAQSVHSRSGSKPNFTKINTEFYRFQPIISSFGLYTKFSGQYSFDCLPSSEEFAIGGKNFGSAYDSSEITGEHGIANRIELQYRGIPTHHQGSTQDFSYYMLYSFYDFGATWNKNRAAGETWKETLADAGFGLNIGVTNNSSANFELGFPLTRKVNAENNSSRGRLFANISFSF